MTGIDTILLDRDGTLIEERHYLRDPDGVILIPGAAEAMRRLAERGLRFFVVSNQSGIGRGLLTLADYQAVHERLRDLLAAAGVQLTDAAFCPHTPADNCACRKPRVGLWEQLATAHDLRPERTAMVGDKIADIAFGRAVGCAETVLVLSGHGADEAEKLGLPTLSRPVETRPAHPGWPDLCARTLTDYLDWLVQKKDDVHAHRI